MVLPEVDAKLRLFRSQDVLMYICTNRCRSYQVVAALNSVKTANEKIFGYV